jgi:hypothetical protein
MATQYANGKIVTNGLVFMYDDGYFPEGWGLTQLIPNPEFIEGSSRPYDHGCYTSGHYLGPNTASIMTGGTLKFTGGDISNYYGTNPEYRSWDGGDIGSTGGNWMHFDVLPSTLSASEDYIVEVRARFVYVSKTGNGSSNPRFQIGRAYYEQYGINYSDLGTEFKTLRFLFNGNSISDLGGSNAVLSFGCTSADAMVELDYFRAYRIEKSSGLSDLSSKGNTINTSNVSFDSNARITFDGTNDTISIPSNASNNIAGNITMELVLKRVNGVSAAVMHKEVQYTLYIASNGDITYADSSYWSYDAFGSHYSGITAGIYHHVVATKNGSLVTIYVDGNVVVSKNFGSAITQTNNPLYIGSYDGTSNYFGGEVPVAKIYNRALSATEVATNYNKYKTKFNLS